MQASYSERKQIKQNAKKQLEIKTEKEVCE